MGNCSINEARDLVQSASNELPSAVSKMERMVPKTSTIGKMVPKGSTPMTKLTTKSSTSKQLTATDIDLLKRATGLSEKEIRDMHAAFLKDHPSGEVDKKGFLKLNQEMSSGSSQSDVLCDNIFALFDKDKSGTVDFKEFMLGMAASNPNDLGSRLEYIFDMCDVSGDGLMDFTELSNLLAASFAASGDKSQAGKVDPRRAATNIYKALGVSTDKKLTKQQFVDGCKRNPDFQKLLGGN